MVLYFRHQEDVIKQDSNHENSEVDNFDESLMQNNEISKNEIINLHAPINNDKNISNWFSNKLEISPTTTLIKHNIPNSTLDVTKLEISNPTEFLSKSPAIIKPKIISHSDHFANSLITPNSTSSLFHPPTNPSHSTNHPKPSKPSYFSLTLL